MSPGVGRCGGLICCIGSTTAEEHSLYRGVTTLLMVRHAPDGARDGHQIGDGLSLVMSKSNGVDDGYMVDLTDHRRSDVLLLLPSRGSFDSALIFKGDGGIDGPSGV
ncbi:hypothetical protein HAX54_051289 [Datura stramonium]|uniref:Uncharacterized protein n=1 Tax=Datura stramonium TaxID=4076 RepID=A0ABS8WR39_DATST|nr:hypothetical protein [Datura stramonium]